MFQISRVIMLKILNWWTVESKERTRSRLDTEERLCIEFETCRVSGCHFSTTFVTHKAKVYRTQQLLRMPIWSQIQREVILLMFFFEQKLAILLSLSFYVHFILWWRLGGEKCLLNLPTIVNGLAGEKQQFFHYSCTFRTSMIISHGTKIALNANAFTVIFFIIMLLFHCELQSSLITGWNRHQRLSISWPFDTRNIAVMFR